MHVRKLKRAATSEFKAKDIVRASGLSLLGVSNSRVARDRQRVKARQELVYAYDEDAVIPCRIV